MDIAIELRVEPGGTSVEAIAVLPPGTASTAADVDVEVFGDDLLLIQLAAGGARREVRLPFAVDADTACVKFRKKEGRLTFSAAARDPEAAARAGARGESAAEAAAATGAGEPAGPLAEAPPPSESLPAAAPHPDQAGEPTAPPAADSNSSSSGPRQLTGERSTSSTQRTQQPPPEPGAPPEVAATPASSSTPPAPCPHHPTAAGPASPASNGALVAPTASSVQAPCPSAVTAAAAPRSPSGNSSASATSAASADDATLYAEFFCNSPPAVPTTSNHSQPSPAETTNGHAPNGHSALPAANAAKLNAAFAPTGGTASRTDGYSFAAPDHVVPAAPLPEGLPPVAPPIDARYLAVANGLRVSAHQQTATMAELLGLRKKPSAAATQRVKERVDAILQQVADTLDAYGYAVLDNFISEAAVLDARKELAVMEPHYSPGLIWVGKESEAGAQISVSNVRGDVVLWLDDQALGATAFVKDGVKRPCCFLQNQQLLADVDELVFEGLRPRLPYLAGLHRRSDAHMAIYPGKGARFARHIDNTTGDGRRLTVVTYLNPGWREDQGGALRVFPVRPGTAPSVDVLPLSGRVALFLSAEVGHEVMPAFAVRHAVTLWYYDAGEHAAALAAARVLPGATSRPSAQAGATEVLRDLLADESTSSIQATPEGLAQLATRVTALEPGAQELLAAVLGVPGRNALVEAFRVMTPAQLHRRREELRVMGLDTRYHAPDTTAHV
ncbi:hypothetical protein HYH03_001459 [Edaphochlamys debaryana]|uniref:Fe2OG dioxygenase domain-containing protein n=1 Tax=Edaphochlamys debaryana TaxID=47281 RepID=A0A835YGB8_9CHLO|nr:hypothetical protein HYH03_001459 [Edaphochlamys debaryana]|eukprot:KAG2500693.1 hypothetical protein HYH03_001459 [Edaphochlamys debaryana]